MAQIRCENVTKKFGPKTAVNNVSFNCADGEFLTIIGRAGAGKTTILEMIAGIKKPTSGSIFIDDKKVNDVPIQERDVAMVFEGYNLYPHFSVYENIAFPLRSPRNTPRLTFEEEKKRVLQIATFLGIHEYLGRKPQHLSGGQRQRVSLARALVREPQLYLLDEPIAHLDARLKFETQTTLKKLAARLGTTIIYVTHDYREALALSDRLLVLRNGTVEQIGTPEEIYNCPASDFTGRFIGDPPINLIDGAVFSKGGELFFQLIGKKVSIRIPARWREQLDAVTWESDGMRLTRLGIRADRVRLFHSRMSDDSFQGPVFATVREKGRMIITLQIENSLMLAETQDLTFDGNASEYWVELDQDSILLFQKTIDLHSHSSGDSASGRRV